MRARSFAAAAGAALLVAAVAGGAERMRGRHEELAVASRALGAERRAIVWVPPGATATSPPLPVLYLLDGLDDGELAEVRTVAEDLIASGRLPPLLLVLVPSVDRRAEHERSEAFERFLVTELVPAVEARWPVREDAAGRGVMGVSHGAFAALSAVARNPGVFGRCGAHSTGNELPANLDLLLADLSRLAPGAARFHVDAGTFGSRLRGEDLLAVSRRVREALGHRQPVQYREFAEGLGRGSRRERLADAWTFLWGDAAPPGPSGPRALAAPPAGARRFTGEPVTLDVKDAELSAVVRTLTEGRGLSVVAPPGFSGTVTASLREVPWDQALDLVLAGNGWAFAREGTVVRIHRRDAPEP